MNTINDFKSIPELQVTCQTLSFGLSVLGAQRFIDRLSQETKARVSAAVTDYGDGSFSFDHSNSHDLRNSILDDSMRFQVEHLDSDDLSFTN